MEIPHVNRWTAWSCVLYTFAAIPPSPSLGLFIPFFSLNKGYPGLAAMQAFLLHCLSLQALRRGAVKRRKGLVYQKMATSKPAMHGGGPRGGAATGGTTRRRRTRSSPRARPAPRRRPPAARGPRGPRLTEF